MYIPARLHPRLLGLNLLPICPVLTRIIYRDYMNNCIHPVYTLTLYPDYAPMLYIPSYSAKTTFTFEDDL